MHHSMTYYLIFLIQLFTYVNFRTYHNLVTPLKNLLVIMTYY